MDIVVIRHAIAMDREEAFARAILDRDRPLSAEGRVKMKRAARGIARSAPGVVSLLTSPFRRAMETARIVQRAYGGIAVLETPALLPDAEPIELAELLSESAPGSPVAVVGHEPHLTRFMGWSIAEDGPVLLELRKGGAGRLRFEDGPAAGRGRLMWLLPPGILRRV
jgi:phosphohistidine phosphatase